MVLTQGRIKKVRGLEVFGLRGQFSPRRVVDLQIIQELGPRKGLVLVHVLKHPVADALKVLIELYDEDLADEEVQDKTGDQKNGHGDKGVYAAVLRKKLHSA